MSVIFQVRSTAFKPWVSRDESVNGLVSVGSPPAIVASGDSRIFGGSYFDVSGPGRAIYWMGNKNGPETNAFAMLVRCIPRSDVAPPGFSSLLCLTGGHSGGSGTNVMELVCTPSGNLRFHWTAEDLNSSSNSIQTANSTIAWANGVPCDFMISWNGDPADVTGFQFSKDGVLILATQLWQPFSAAGVLRAMIQTTIGDSSAFGYADINEIVIFNNAQSAVYAPRTGFWPAAQFDGSVYTDPLIANVANGVGYTYAGIPKVGLLNTVTNVLKAGTLVGQSLTATLKGK